LQSGVVNIFNRGWGCFSGIFLGETMTKEPNPCANCGSAKSELRKRVVGGGSIQYRWQCLKCGRSVSNPIPHSEIRHVPPEWNFGLEEHYNELRKHQQGLFDTPNLKLNAEAPAQFGYDEYLQSPEWKAIRAKIMNRSGGKCEGCIEGRATQVHHLTYKHIYHEFAFELVALCDGCHERIHALDRQ
jgi:hypothetical protein